jgi:hypothetical protein
MIYIYINIKKKMFKYYICKYIWKIPGVVWMLVVKPLFLTVLNAIWLIIL